jgi:hypothetical protein
VREGAGAGFHLRFFSSVVISTLGGSVCGSRVSHTRSMRQHGWKSEARE